MALAALTPSILFSPLPDKNNIFPSSLEMFAGYLRLNPPGAFASERARYREKTFYSPSALRTHTGHLEGLLLKVEGEKVFATTTTKEKLRLGK